MSRLVILFEETFHEPVLRSMPVSAHASERRLVRLIGQTRRAIAVMNTDLQENNAFRELTQHFRKFGLPVPEIFSEEVEAGIALIEDFGERTLYDYLSQSSTLNPVPSDISDWYHEAVSVLPRLQIEAGRSAPFHACHPRKKFDSESMLWDMNYFLDQYVGRQKIPFDIDEVKDDFAQLAQYLVGAKADFFMYRDFQSRNIMALAGGKIGCIDYQGGRQGPLQYDLASLLYQSRAQLPAEFREQLLQHYLRVASEFEAIHEEEFRSYLDGFILIRLMQVLGAYGKVGIGGKKPFFFESIPYALKNVQELLLKIRIPISLPSLTSLLNKVIHHAPNHNS